MDDMESDYPHLWKAKYILKHPSIYKKILRNNNYTLQIQHAKSESVIRSFVTAYVFPDYIAKINCKNKENIVN